MQQTPSCQFYPSASSSCHRRPTTHYYGSVERGPLWLCVNKHLKEQERCDQTMREQVQEGALQEKIRACGLVLGLSEFLGELGDQP